ncbi:MAG: hypothetical protein A3D92_01020, partial [Bacteroidetes bacterium RIFCSPHIGHO2_02_FULL_44_7]
ENHLKPRKRDNLFGRDVHERLLFLIDEDKMLFEAGDIEELTLLADSIDEDLNEEKLRYVHRFLELYHARVDASEKFFADLSKSAPDVYGNEIGFKGKDGYAQNVAERKLRWKNHLLYALQFDVLRSLDRGKALDEADVKTASEKYWPQVKTEYTDYMGSLNDIEENFELLYLNAVALAYDPHSSYFNDEMREEFSEELTSSQFKFGITYGSTLDGQIEITEVLPGSSAWFSEEVQEGALILSIRSSTGQFLDVAKSKTKDLSDFFGALDTDSITLELRFEDEDQFANLVRSRVYSDNDIIKTALLEGERKIGYISLPDFYTSWTDTSDLGCANDVAKSILKLKKANIEGLILDLRDNGGGSLREAVDLVGVFIDFGPVLLIEEADGSVTSMKDFNRGSMYSGPLMVLVNSESASASELVAGTLQDYNRALIVGQTSFGKATGQTILPLDPMAKYTGYLQMEDPSWGYAKTTDIGLYRLTKNSTQLKGVVPDVETPDFSIYTPQYESQEAHAIVLDSVDKKVYPVFLPKLPAAELKAWYSSQKNSAVDSMQALLVHTQTLAERLESILDLRLAHATYMELEHLKKEFDRLHDNFKFSYLPSSFQFDEALLRMSPYLDRYNANFLERLAKDLELNEDYKVMLQLVKIND